MPQCVSKPANKIRILKVNSGILLSVLYRPVCLKLKSESTLAMEYFSVCYHRGSSVEVKTTAAVFSQLQKQTVQLSTPFIRKQYKVIQQNIIVTLFILAGTLNE